MTDQPVTGASPDVARLRTLMATWRGFVDPKPFGRETTYLVYCEARKECADELEAALAAAERPTPAAKCVMGVYCHNHGFIHGAEAEELRQRIERAIKGADHEGCVDEDDLQRILDEVDARDSLAWQEVAAPLAQEGERS